MSGPSGDIASDRMWVSSADVVMGLLAALGWAVVTTARLASLAPPPLLAPAALGCAAASAVPIVVFARTTPSCGATAYRVAVTLLTSLAPIAVVAAVLKTKTHHRALGGVVFAVLVVGLLPALYLVVRRALAARGGAGRAGRLAIFALVVASLGWTLVSLFGPASTGWIRAAAWDGAAGALFVSIAIVAPRHDVAALTPRAAAFVFCAVVAIGGNAVWRKPVLLTALCEGAPVTLGIFSAFGCR